MGFVSRLREVHEIEFSSRCNLACKYCPHPKLERPKEDMALRTFFATMALVQRLCDEGTQGEVSLTGIGEAVLHPDFLPMAREVRRVIGWERPLVLATNGVALTEGLVFEFARLRPHVYVSLHRPEMAAPAIELLKKYRVEHAVNSAFVTSSLDWAGQVDWYVSAPKSECQYLARGWGVVRTDGRITTCCMDAHTKHAFGTVWTDPAELLLRPHELCGACNLMPPVERMEVERVA
jgi:hypothetical protein